MIFFQLFFYHKELVESPPARSPLRNQKKTIHYSNPLPSFVNCQLSTVNCQLSTVNCQLNIALGAAKQRIKTASKAKATEGEQAEYFW
ncbi:hypothetical protein [Microcoleus sp. PH2017_09_SFU_O_A]|uniref:hypothetical protein n=1 Tax=Microcoleus sp. PH2017_09_SFU_O_A TaxID=2798820 RepID=UPI001D1A7BB4|nr:hypothetical protein [Microcoleus sp. PH2017_09_SFU_O_A]MCC3448948.1 hypothetical protein [Microcoleus sp. PH2017_09_SFU_O_A]